MIPFISHNIKIQSFLLHDLEGVEGEVVAVLPVLPPHRLPSVFLPELPAVEHDFVEIALEGRLGDVSFGGVLSAELFPLRFAERRLVLFVGHKHHLIAVPCSDLLQDLTDLDDGQLIEGRLRLPLLLRVIPRFVIPLLRRVPLALILGHYGHGLV